MLQNKLRQTEKPCDQSHGFFLLALTLESSSLWKGREARARMFPPAVNQRRSVVEPTQRACPKRVLALVSEAADHVVEFFDRDEPATVLKLVLVNRLAQFGDVRVV